MTENSQHYFYIKLGIVVIFDSKVHRNKQAFLHLTIPHEQIFCYLASYSQGDKAVRPHIFWPCGPQIHLIVPFCTKHKLFMCVNKGVT